MMVPCGQGLPSAYPCEYRFDNVPPLLQDLGWLPFAFQIQHFYLFPYSLRKYLLTTYCASGTVLGVR